MSKDYSRRHQHEVYLFEEGDSVYLKQRRQGKLLPKSIGPYTFVKYKGTHRKAAIVLTTAGKLIDVSCE